MLTGQPQIVALCLVASGLLAGCAHTDAILPRRTTLGTLKTSVSHLEFEKEELRREVAKLQSENREIQDRLVQEEAANGDLTARLDDARHELSRRGIDAGDDRANASRSSQDSFDPPTTLRAGRSSRKTRKPPVTRIPGRSSESASPSDSDDEIPVFSPKSRSGDDLGARSLPDDPDRWLPIAHGTSSPPTKTR